MQNLDIKNLGKVLVTGATGFVGSALVKKLLSYNVYVRAMDNNSRGNINRLKDNLNDIEFIKGDVTSINDCLNACENIDTVFHLAAINGTENFYKIPNKVLEVGVKGAFNTMEAAIKCGVKNYIVTSSSEVYQEPINVPTDENERIIIPDIHNPRFSYSIGKIVSEAVAIHSSTEEIKTVICRPHNFYGPDMGFAHVIPQFILRMKELSNNFKKELIDFPIQGEGKETRSFCFVDDGVNGIICAAIRGKNKEIYHLGTEDEFSIYSIAELIGELLGLNLNIIKGEKMDGGTTRRCPKINKASGIGFKPIVKLKKGIASTIEWYINNSLKDQSDIVTK